MEKLTYTHSFRRLLAYKLARELSLLVYEKHFISKLTDADGEQQETQHWLETAVNCHHLTPAETDPFCNPDNYRRETAVNYFIEQET